MESLDGIPSQVVSAPRLPLAAHCFPLKSHSPVFFGGGVQRDREDAAFTPMAQKVFYLMTDNSGNAQ